MSGDLSGEVALVTGGSRGVGRLVALALARAGASVAVASRTPAELDATAEEEPHRLLPVVLDVTDEPGVLTAVGEVEDLLGPLTILVNNAGTLAAIGPLWDVSAEDWRCDVETSLFGSFNLCRAVVPGMVERRRGRILNVTSSVAVRPSPYYSGYAAGKAALLNLTEALAAETAPHGLAVFAVTPGQMPTELITTLRDSAAGRRWLPEAVHGDFVPVERLEALVTALASGRADALSGRFLHALDDIDEILRNVGTVEREGLYAARLHRL